MRRVTRRSRPLLTLALLVACRAGGGTSAPVTPLVAPPAAPTAVTPGERPPAEPPAPRQVAVQGPGSELPPALAATRVRGIEWMDAGRFDLAREAFAEVLDGAPGNLAAQALYDGATAAMLAAQRDSAAAFANRDALRIAEPPWEYTLRRAVPLASPGPPPRLVQASQARNAITDDADWFQRNQLELPEYEVPNPMRGQVGSLPPSIPPSFGKFLLVQAIRQGPYHILFYGPDYSGGRFVAVQRAEGGEIVALLDFEAWQYAPKSAPAERMFVDQRAIWAAVEDGVLYLSFGHHTYARSSGGQNAYLSALDLASGELLWRSAPLVAGAATFVIRGGAIITGYGFTAEPDALYVLDRATGRTLSKTRVKSGPNYLLLREGRLFVRCYDQDYEFLLQ